MRIHILGICGTFMAGIAKLAKALGYTVTGTDQNVYPPMSTILQSLGVNIAQGYHKDSVPADVDLVIVGNAMSRGNPAVESVLNKNIPFISGPQWLYEHVLKDRHVLAVAGTHGKTTTSAMLAWMLESAGLHPGFLIGGVPKNFNETARLGSSNYFVIEADEYDTAFYDKRAKFLHYHPRTLIMNNLEFDHADIYEDLAAIQKQCQFLLRTVPGDGLVIYPHDCDALKDVVARGCWSRQVALQENKSWRVTPLKTDYSAFDIIAPDQQSVAIHWKLLGAHNMQNALAAAVAAFHVGVSLEHIKIGLETFENVKRRMEVRAVVRGITVYDDFAHHPTAIETTINGLRAKVGDERVIVLAQLGSNTMEKGVHQLTLGAAFHEADQVHIWHPEKSDWDIAPVLNTLNGRGFAHPTVDDMMQTIIPQLKSKDHVLIMSNKGFEGIHERLIAEI